MNTQAPKLYNTLTGTKEELKTIEPGKVRLYTCGLTVYSHPHIGNWLGYIYWDILVRTLLADGYAVERTQNITDVGHLTSDDDSGEDKMEKGARIEGTTAWDIARKYTDIADHEAYDLLGLIRPEHLIPATEFISQQIDFTRDLEGRGYTYIIPGEGLYFDTAKLSDYGKLARLNIAGLEAGARVAIEGKRNITDFAIWKLSPGDKQRDMEWDSPWGKGFPGWHLECSAIARETLGDQIDIHTGGIDHIPVHHTNEIAQTEAVTGQQFSQIWLHNNHIKVDGTKISKSLGNVFTLDDIKQRGYDIDTYKLLALSKHYRTEGNFTWEIMDASAARLKHWQAIASLRWQLHDTLENDSKKDDDYAINGKLLAAPHAFLEALNDDLNTPKALAIIDDAFDAIDRVGDIRHIQQSALVSLLQHIDDLLGLRLISSTPDISDEQKMLVLERQRAREAHNWKRSDEIRNVLAEQGIILNDTSRTTIWARNN
ncbi:cysteine--tRNA ligase [Candidatus Saccharibacteria bacterium]|nr:cysteine--tRNA ligase [Candidatus Saccharibacteria bacterium]